MTALRTHGSSISMKFIPMTEPLYDYLVAHGHNGDPVLAELAKETARPRADLDDADRARAGHADVDPGARHRRALGGRDRHLHRLQRALRRARPAGRRAACCAATSARSGRRSRAATGRRPASPTASSCAWRRRSRRCAPCPPIDHVRLRLHRRRQGVLPRLLRSAAAAHAAERSDRLRQRPVDGPGARRRSPNRTTRVPCSS